MRLFNRKNEISAEQIRSLLRLFLDGDTTPEQEKTLYTYFRRKKLPADLVCYREMFAWYDDLEHEGKETSGRVVRARMWIPAAAIALLALVGVSVMMNRSLTLSAAESMYAGSYIIRNGEKITDIKKILPELRRADRIIDSTLTALSLDYPDNPEAAILNEAVCHIADPEIRNMLLADLN